MHLFYTVNAFLYFYGVLTLKKTKLLAPLQYQKALSNEHRPLYQY